MSSIKVLPPQLSTVFPAETRIVFLFSGCHDGPEPCRDGPSLQTTFLLVRPETAGLLHRSLSYKQESLKHFLVFHDAQVT